MTKSVSLDNEVVARIETEAIEEERPFSQIVNRRLRDAFGIMRRTSAATESASRRSTPRSAKKKGGRAA